MGWTKNNKCICDECGLFCVPYDEWTPFGCADPENPEPYDPSHSCKKCFLKLKDYWRKSLTKAGGRLYGDWQKSRAEMEVAEELGLIWLHSEGLGAYNSKDSYQPYQYVPKTEFERLKDVPRFVKI